MCNLSIIIPVYNAEKYLQECVKAIIQQEVQSLEIILVDDGSQDNSLQICNELVRKYRFIKCIHQDNLGPSAARNAGLKIADGKYILFCDSDDQLLPESLNILYSIAEENSTDVLEFGYILWPSGKCILPNVKTGCVISPAEFISSSNSLHSDNIFCYPWRFLFNRKFLVKKNIIFDENIHIGEDVLFSIRAIMEADRVFVLDKALYQYRTDNLDSIMSRYKPLLVQWINEQYIEKMKLTNKYGLNNNKQWMEDLSYYYITRFQHMMLKNAFEGPVETRLKAVKEILNSQALQDNYQIHIMFKAGIKHGIFCMMCKMKMYVGVYKLCKRWYQD